MLDGAPPAPTLALARDTGISSSDLITNDPGLSVSGLVPGAIVEYWSDYSTEWSTFFEPAGPLVTVMARQVVNGQPSPPSAFLSFDYDTIGPSPQVSAFSQSLFTPNSPSSDIVFTFFEEEVFGFTADDIVVTGGTISEFGASGLNYSAIFTAAPNFTGTGTVSMAANASFSDVAGNYGQADLLLFTFSIFDNLAPSITIESSAASLAEGETALITFTLTEPSASFDLSDVSFTGGALSNFSGTGAEYSAIFTPLPDFAGTGSISVAAGTFTDLSGNANASGDSDAAITINIDTVVVPPNNSPTGIALSSASIAENSPAGTAVGTLSTTDPDEGNTFTYTFVTGDGSTDNASFTIVGNQLQAAASLDFEAKGTYSVRVRSTDEGGLFVDRQFTIMVANVNEAPTGVSLSSSSIAENQPLGSIVGTLSTTDPDTGDSFVYAFASGIGDSDNNSFQIVNNQLRTNAVFNHGDRDSYSVRVRSIDSGGLATEQVFLLNIRPLLGAIGTHVIDGRACVGFAGIPEMSFGGPEFKGIGVLPEADLSVAETRPIPLSVTGLSRITVSALGQWGHQAGGETGPSGALETRDTSSGYTTFGISALNDAPLNMLQGVFVDDTLFYERGLPPDAVSYEGQPVSNPSLFQTFPIGQFSADIIVPPGATRLYLGLHDGYEWSNNTGAVSVTISAGGHPASPESDFMFSNGTITGYTGPGGDVVIPSTISGVPVTGIGDRAFSWRHTLTSITLPDSLTSIGNSAFSYCNRLTSVTLPTSLASIGNSAFSSCSSLTSITLPASLTSIGDWAFSGCTHLTSIAMPSSLTSIGDGAFSGCTSLTGIALSVSLVSIGNSAFSSCSSLTSITLPATLTSIGDAAFSWCTSLTSIVVAPENSSFQVVDGVLYDEAGTRLICCPAGRQGEVTVLPTVTIVGNWAFSGCTGLTSIALPASLTSIGDRAFSGCATLTSIALPASLTSIGHEVFSWCTSLTSITLPASLTSIGDWAFSGCTGLTSIALPASLTSIGYRAFSGCTGLTGITLPASLTSIGDGAFSGCTGLTSISVAPENPSFQAIDGVLYDKAGTRLICCPARKQGAVTILSTVTVIGDGAFSGCTGLTSIALPASLTSIGNSAFSSCGSLTSIALPASLTTIGHEVFSGCTGLISIALPASLTSIGYKMFSGCTSLTSIALPASLTSIGHEAFSGCSSLTSIALPASLTSIESRAFSGCTGLTSITLPASLTSVGDGAFAGCTGLTSIVVAPENSSFQVVDGVLYDEAGTRLICCPAGRQGEVTVLPTVTIVGNWAFSGCTGLTSITLPASLTSIGDGAFSGCTGLTSIALPASLTGIGNWAFSGCTGLTSIALPASLTTIGHEVFSGCTGLISIALPASLTSIGYKMFSGCTSLTSIALPASLTSIGYEAFSGCSSLTSIALPASLTSIESRAFSGCTGLTSITLPASLASIGDGAFSDCTNLTSVELPASITSIGRWAFSWCTSLTSIALPASLTSIGDGAFSWCSSLTSIMLPASLTSIGDRVFSYCSALTSIVIAPENSSFQVVDGVLYDKAGTRLICCPAGRQGEVTVLPTVTIIGEWAFSGCTGLTGITLPASLTSIGDGAFSGCTGLTSISVAPENPSFQAIDGVLYDKAGTRLICCPAGKQGEVTVLPTVTIIGNWAFSGCTGLTGITLPMSLTRIGDAAFSWCTSLASITLPVSLTSIGHGAFYNCTSLTSITLPASLVTIGGSAFSGCTGLTRVMFLGDAPTTLPDLFSGGDQVTVYYLPQTSGWSSTFEGRPTVAAVVPTSPTTLTAIGDDRRVTLTWSAPQSDGNNPITDYVIEYRESAGTDWTVFDDGESAANSTIVTGLTNGVGYVFRVAAKNAVGLGDPTEDSTVVVPQAAARNVSISLGNGGELFIDGQPVTYAGDPVTASFQSWNIFEAAVIRGQNLFFAQHSAGVIHRLYANSDWSLVGGLYGVGSAYSIYLPRSARGPEFPVEQEPEPLPSDFLTPVENSGVRLRIDPNGQLYADQTMLTRQESSVGVKLTDLAGYSPIAVMRENTDSTWRHTLLWRHRIDQSLIEWQFNSDWVYQGTSRVPIETNAALELAYQVDINRDGSLA